MRRAWPFQNEPEGGDTPDRTESIADFVAQHADVEAVVIRIGLHDAQIVLVDGDGRWDRWVFHSVERARAAANDLHVTVHDDAFPEHMRARMNARQRPVAEFDAGAYPEQGKVGPVIPYRENRPRRARHRPDSTRPSAG